MREKLIAQKSLACMCLSISFFLSLLVSPKIEGGFHLKLHAGVLINLVLAIIYMIVMGREARFRGWTTTGSVLTLCGTFLGVFAISNIVLISPFEGYGLKAAFFLELLLLINFRHQLMPFHQKGRRLMINLLMGILLLLIFKLLIMAGIQVPFFSIDSSFDDHLNMPLMSGVWLLSLASAFVGLYVMGLSIRKENEIELDSIKEGMELNQRHLVILGIKNEDLLGMTKHQIDDEVNDRIREIVGEYKRFKELQHFANQLPDPENSWAAPLVLELKQSEK